MTGEEDGHENAEGRDYREPRTAFVGTRWNGIKNAYIRIDERNTDRPGGSRPLGYIWVPSINGDRRVLSQTLADEERLNLQAKNRQRPSGERLETLLGDDVPNCSLMELSFYVSAVWATRCRSAGSSCSLVRGVSLSTRAAQARR